MYFNMKAVKECKPHLFKHNRLWVFIPAESKPNPAAVAAASQFCKLKNDELFNVWIHS
ncbi:hypothetical protein AABM17_748 [Neisseria musculi]|uniref:Uncharacterized protein n=2 Tax=Neisseria TaxID=482 RepID=A0A448D9N5_9NEIS|nr:hypothetical protein H7A79_0748 [Neisseria musculi]VEF02419.1 Uncharacterised protein [Neisseria canis]